VITIKEEDYSFEFWPRQRGGQHVGTDATIIVVHKPSGVAIIEGGERSYMRNKARGLERLTALLIEAGSLGCACSHED
jgi:protein subunit release factor A